MNIVINAHKFAAASLWAAKKDIRTYLNGVLIEPLSEGGAAIVGSNGHVLCAIRDTFASCGNLPECGIIIGELSEIVKHAAKRGADRVVITDETIKVCDELLNVLYISPRDTVSHTLKGPFAPWRRVILEPQHGKQASWISSDYLSLPSDTAKILFGKMKDGKGTQIISGGWNDSAVISFEGYADFYGLISPMRFDDGASSWLFPHKKTATSKAA
jgi:hypothetical protein